MIYSSLSRGWLLSWVWSLDVTALADPSDLQQSRQGMVAVVGFGRLMQLHWRTRVIYSSLGRGWLLSWVWSLDVTALADPSDLQ